MRWLGLLMVLVLSVGCTKEDVPKETGQVEEEEAFFAFIQQSEAEILASYLKVPWDINKAGDDFYISERPGNIVKVIGEGDQTRMPMNLKREITEYGEGGLLGFVLHPEFNQNSLAYIYHTYRDGNQVRNRIVELKLENTEWVEQKELLGNIPGGRIHNGGRLEIGPDRKLYATVGDAGNPNSAQNRDVLSGSILRMELDGSVPEDNPFPESLIFSYGHRNPQGIAWDDNGNMYAAEHGQTAHDEINAIEPGGNYGWPVIQGDETKEGMIKPLFHSGETTWAPSGLTFHDGKLIVAGLAGRQLRTFDLETMKSDILFKNAGRLRDLLVENNDLYVITNNTDGRGTPDEDDDHLLKLRLE